MFFLFISLEKHEERGRATNMNYPKMCGHKQKVENVLTIGLLNLMPNKEKTNQQWAQVFEKVASQVRWQYFGLESHRPKSLESLSYARDSARINEETLKGIDILVLTGAPVEKMPFEDVYYWEELSGILSLLVSKKIPILAVCWGAQALLYQLKNVDKVLYESKITGVFPHEGIGPFSELGAFGMPHSRYTGWSLQELKNTSGLSPVITMDSGEWVGLIDEHGNLYISGHPEYEEDTLILEYQRDLQKGVIDTKPDGYDFTKKMPVLKYPKWDKILSEAIFLWIRNQ